MVSEIKLPEGINPGTLLLSPDGLATMIALTYRGFSSDETRSTAGSFVCFEAL